MSTAYRPTGGIVVAIEQAIARGETLDRICDTLRVDPTMVDRVLRRMDAALAEPDVPNRVTRRKNPEVNTAGRPLAPHGTHAAFVRHRSYKQEPCEPCRTAEREYHAARHRRRRQERAA